MNKKDQYDTDDRFSILEDRISRLESLVLKITESKEDSGSGFAVKPDASSFNALGIATVAQIYLANKTGS